METQEIYIAKRYVIFNGLYTHSKVDGTNSSSFSEKTNSWLVNFPFKEAADGRHYDDSAISVFISSDRETVHMFF